jgi:microcystin-dependent protein
MLDMKRNRKTPTRPSLLFLIAGLTLIYHSSFCQSGVGIGVVNPDASAVLHVQPPSNNKGLLIPRLTTLQRNSISPAADGLLVYDTDLKRFCFYNGGWFTLNEMTNPAGSTAITHAGSVSVTGTISATNYGLNSTGNGPIPQGGIIMWSGVTAPTGWALCDGQNGTPDLRGRFIVGVGQNQTPASGDNNPNYAIGPGTGMNAVTLTTAEMPTHNHGVSDPAHNHSELRFDQISTDWRSGGASSPGNGTGRNATTTTGFGFTGISIQNTGGNLPHENRPPYYALAYIMKL